MKSIKRKKLTLSLSFFKRGNVQELLYLVAFFIFFVLISIFGYKILGDFNDKIQNMTDVPNIAKDANQTIANNYPGWLDNAFLIVVIIMYIGALISAWYVDSNPIFFIISVIFLIIVLFVVGILSNLNEEILSDATFSSILSDFPIMVFFSQHMMAIVTVLSGGILIALYAKSRSEQ